MMFNWLTEVCVIGRFTAGDVVMMRPCNTPEDVEQFCQLLRLDPDRQFTLSPTNCDTGLCLSHLTACIGVREIWSHPST